MKVYKVFLPAALCCLSACSTQQLAQYQKKIAGTAVITDAASANQWVTVSVHNNANAANFSGAPAAAPVKHTVFDLTDKGQQALVRALADKTKDDKSLLADLSAQFTAPDDGSGGSGAIIDKTEYLKKLEIDVDNPNASANRGRIQQLVVWVTLADNSDIVFTGFNNLTTKYISTDFGTVSHSHTTGFTLNAGINLGGTGSTSNSTQNVNNGTTTGNTGGSTTSNTSNLGASYSNSMTSTEQADIKNNTITMKGSLDRTEASLMQNGVPNQDLNDNIDLELLFSTEDNLSEPYIAFKGLADNDGKAVTDAAKLSLSEGYIILSKPIKHDVHAKLSYTFAYRDVLSGQNTVTESDDKVYFYNLLDRNVVSKDFVILKANETNFKLYQVALADGSADEHSPNLYLVYNGQPVRLLFNDLGSCQALINWLIATKADSIKDCAFKIGVNAQHLSPYKASMINQLTPLLVRPVVNP